MLNLVLTTDKISVITSSGADIDAHASFVDTDSIVTSTSNMTPGKKNTAITTATTTDVVDVPGGSTTRNVKFLSLRNIDGAASNDLTVQFNANGTLYTLMKATLLAGEELVCREGVWFHYDTNGGVYGGFPIATQSEMEGATALTSAVVPGRVHFHPGVAKCVLFTTGTATPVAAVPPTYGCTITDTNVGRLTINFNTAFSAITAYSVQVNVEVISTTLTAAANVMQGYMRFGGQASASSCEVNCCDRTATTNVIRDPISWHATIHGDQA